MRCETPSTDLTQPDKKQLSFVYQPGVGLYDKKKNEIDASTTADVDERIESENFRPTSPIVTLSDKNKQSPSQHIKLSDINQENKRKFDQNEYSNKKLCHSKCEENLLDQELDNKASKLIQNDARSNLNQLLHKQSIIKNIPMVKTSSSENQIPSQGLLLCPKEDPIKKKKKKKIAPTITSCTELLDEDPVLDSILFNEMQSVQQQWQQFLILTMEKELHINPSDGKKKPKLNKFNRTNDFLLAYESLYDFEGMKHWYPLSR